MKIKLYLLAYRYKFTDFLRNIKRRVWDKRINLLWHRLFIRKDEFHSSLDLDGKAMLVMNKKEREKYLNDLMRRRSIAHEADLAS